MSEATGTLHGDFQGVQEQGGASGTTLPSMAVQSSADARREGVAEESEPEALRAEREATDGTELARERAGIVEPVRLKQVKRKERWVEISDDDGSYEGFQFRLWVNYPQRLEEELKSGNEDRIAQALMRIVPEHNGWADEEGKPYPPANTEEFWKGERAIPNELIQAVITLVHLESSRLPNSLMQRFRNTRST